MVYIGAGCFNLVLKMKVILASNRQIGQIYYGPSLQLEIETRCVLFAPRDSPDELSDPTFIKNYKTESI